MVQGSHAYVRLFDYPTINFSFEEMPKALLESLSYDEQLQNIKTAVKIVSCMKDNPYITIPELCEQAGLSDRGVRYHIEILKKAGTIVRIGPDKGGQWKVKK
ncbi:MAG: winged helix-turn-helix transcriptional regulator [Bacteroidales bacterium]|nr:winged helix-turn-helix transcriptional regulator [Bacteroidales bacterium]